MDRNTPADSGDCPTWETLVDFHKGLLPEPALQEIAGHLAGCPRCEGAVRDLHSGGAGDDGADWLRRWLQWPSLLEEPGWARMKAGAEAIVGGAQQLTEPEPARGEEPGRWVGRTVGHYVVLGKIGQGGMGVVYRARQEPIGRIVALKMVLAGVHAGEHLLARFGIEGMAAGRLHHPNVVQIYEFAEHDGLPYYTMELVEGESLQARLRRGPLEPHEAATLVRTLAAAVEFAHNKHVLHRDLKPGNVLLTAAACGLAEGAAKPQAAEVPKITDFGLAKLLDAEGQGQTQTNALLGTPSYMAPEQAQGRRDQVGRATDVWALGAILYECLSGQVPFKGQTTMETLDLVRSAEPIPPSRRRPGIPAGLDHICLKCLEKAPGDRYTTAKALADDLDRWLRDERPVSTPRWLRRAWKGLRRRAGLFCLGLALLGGAAVYVALPDPAPRRTAEELALERIERDLDAGGAVTLIGSTGGPDWYRWRTGGKKSTTSLDGDDGIFSVHSFTLSLLELLPGPRHDRYRFRAQVRHVRSEHLGEVGIFFACQACPWAPTDLQVFVQVTFNDVRGAAEGVKAMAPGVVLRPRDNLVDMLLHMHSEERGPSSIDIRDSLAAGPRFKLAGPNVRWRDCEVIVTPEAVTARWEGKEFGLPMATIRQRLQLCTHRLRAAFPMEPFLQGLQPALEARGGLGLYVLNGLASFRDVSVTPILENP